MGTEGRLVVAQGWGDGVGGAAKGCGASLCRDEKRAGADCGYSRNHSVVHFE